MLNPWESLLKYPNIPLESLLLKKRDEKGREEKGRDEKGWDEKGRVEKGVNELFAFQISTDSRHLASFTADRMKLMPAKSDPFLFRIESN